MKGEIGNWRLKLKKEIDDLFSEKRQAPEESKLGSQGAKAMKTSSRRSYATNFLNKKRQEGIQAETESMPMFLKNFNKDKSVDCLPVKEEAISREDIRGNYERLRKEHEKLVHAIEKMQEEDQQISKNLQLEDSESSDNPEVDPRYFETRLPFSPMQTGRFADPWNDSLKEPSTDLKQGFRPENHNQFSPKNQAYFQQDLRNTKKETQVHRNKQNSDRRYPDSRDVRGNYQESRGEYTDKAQKRNYSDARHRNEDCRDYRRNKEDFEGQFEDRGGNYRQNYDRNAFYYANESRKYDKRMQHTGEYTQSNEMVRVYPEHLKRNHGDLRQNMQNFEGNLTEYTGGLRRSPEKYDELRNSPEDTDYFRRSPNITDDFRTSPKDKDYHRRSPEDTDYFRRSPKYKEDFGRSPKNIEDFGRSPKYNEGFGRNPRHNEDFGRNPRHNEDFGRNPRHNEDFRRSPEDIDYFRGIPDDFYQKPEDLRRITNEFSIHPDQHEEFRRYPIRENPEYFEHPPAEMSHSIGKLGISSSNRIEIEPKVNLSPRDQRKSHLEITNNPNHYVKSEKAFGISRSSLEIPQNSTDHSKPTNMIPSHSKHLEVQMSKKKPTLGVHKQIEEDIHIAQIEEQIEEAPNFQEPEIVSTQYKIQSTEIRIPSKRIDIKKNEDISILPQEKESTGRHHQDNYQPYQRAPPYYVPPHYPMDPYMSPLYANYFNFPPYMQNPYMPMPPPVRRQNPVQMNRVATPPPYEEYGYTNLPEEYIGNPQGQEHFELEEDSPIHNEHEAFYEPEVPKNYTEIPVDKSFEEKPVLSRAVNPRAPSKAWEIPLAPDPVIEKPAVKQPSKAWEIPLNEQNESNKFMKLAENINKRHAGINKERKKEKTKEELAEIRKQMMKRKPQAKEETLHANYKPEPSQKGNTELLHRLAMGERAKVTKREMHRLTAKYSQNSQEVKEKEREEQKKEELKKRILNAKAYDERRQNLRRMKNNN